MQAKRNPARHPLAHRIALRYWANLRAQGASKASMRRAAAAVQRAFGK